MHSIPARHEPWTTDRQPVLAIFRDSLLLTEY